MSRVIRVFSSVWRIKQSSDISPIRLQDITGQLGEAFPLLTFNNYFEGNISSYKNPWVKTDPTNKLKYLVQIPWYQSNQFLINNTINQMSSAKWTNYFKHKNSPRVKMWTGATSKECIFNCIFFLHTFITVPGDLECSKYIKLKHWEIFTFLYILWAKRTIQNDRADIDVWINNCK